MKLWKMNYELWNELWKIMNYEKIYGYWFASLIFSSFYKYYQTLSTVLQCGHRDSLKWTIRICSFSRSRGQRSLVEFRPLTWRDGRATNKLCDEQARMAARASATLSNDPRIPKIVTADWKKASDDTIKFKFRRSGTLSSPLWAWL